MFKQNEYCPNLTIQYGPTTCRCNARNPALQLGQQAIQGIEVVAVDDAVAGANVGVAVTERGFINVERGWWRFIAALLSTLWYLSTCLG